LHYLARQEESRYHLKPKGAAAACTELLPDNKVSYLRKDENENMVCYYYAARNGPADMLETLGGNLPALLPCFIGDWYAHPDIR
jgi:hypothetical protein